MSDADRATFQAATITPPDDDSRSPEDRAFLRKHGEALVIQLFAASKTIRLYDVKNRAAQRALAEVEASIGRIAEREGRVFIRVAADFLLLNEYRIPFEPQHYSPFEYWVTEMNKRGVEGIEIAKEAKVEEIARFLVTFFAVEGGEGACEEIEKRLAAEKVSRVTLTKWVERETRLEDRKKSSKDVRRESNRVYFRTVALIGSVLRTVEEKQILQVRKAMRLTQQMVDIIHTDESMLLGLASIKNFDAYTFAHSVNVCILSMLIGDRMRLGKTDVARLGVVALFHDIGKTNIPSSILNSTGKLSDREWELMKYHTFFGVKELSRVNALRDAVDAMFVALQHHVHFNENGYPQRPGGWKLRLFTRIVTVADYYDAMTSWRVYQKEPITPDRALRFILENSGEIFDPFVAKVFLQAMGLYPVGTVVELDGGETAIVTRQNGDLRHLHRPVVEVLRLDSGRAVRELVDLSERNPDGRYVRTIVRAVHESHIGVDKRLCFLADPAVKASAPAR